MDSARPADWLVALQFAFLLTSELPY